MKKGLYLFFNLEQIKIFILFCIARCVQTAKLTPVIYWLQDNNHYNKLL
jgi:hypothetical protein